MLSKKICHFNLSAIIDWHSRFIVGWRLHDTLGAEEAVACMESAIERHGCPAISNSDYAEENTKPQVAQSA